MMPAPRYQTTGRDSWLAQTGYQHRSRNDAPIQSDDEFTPLGFVKGVGALMLGFGLLAALWVMLP